MTDVRPGVAELAAAAVTSDAGKQQHAPPTVFARRETGRSEIAFVPFPKIHGFASVATSVKKQPLKETVSTFHGSVKLHGTNASFVWRPTAALPWSGFVYAQSRSHVLLPPDDNNGFRQWLEARAPHTISALMRAIVVASYRSYVLSSAREDDETWRWAVRMGYVWTVFGESPPMRAIIAPARSDVLGSSREEGEAWRWAVRAGYVWTVFGEFCGRGVQKSVAISKLPGGRRIFAMFAVRVHSPSGAVYWLRIDEPGIRHSLGLPLDDMHNVFDAPTFSVQVDWADRRLAIDRMAQLTADVERECPVALQIGGVRGLGEGIVWAARAPGLDGESFFRLVFKTKGRVFDDTVRKKQVTDEPELSADVKTFVDKVATTLKFEQAWARASELVPIVLPMPWTWVDYDADRHILRDPAAIQAVSSPPRLVTLRQNILATVHSRYPGSKAKSEGPAARHREEFGSWFVADVIEEQRDAIVASGLGMKLVRRELAARALAAYVGIEAALSRSELATRAHTSYLKLAQS
jgi:hypothetical protein